LKKKIVSMVLIFVVLLVLGGCGGTPETKTTPDAVANTETKTAGEIIKWKVQGFTPANTLYDSWGKHLSETINELSSGRLVVEFFPAGTIVPSAEAPDAVKNGILNASFSYSGMWSGLNPVAPLFTSVPGLFNDPNDMIAWIEQGGGLELWNEMLAPHNSIVIPAYCHISEIFMWSNKPIRTVQDMKGIKLRMMPVMGKVLEANGMNVAFLPAGELIPSLQKKVLDAAEYSIPAFDITLGFQDVAKYYTVPGLHQPCGVGQLVINKDSWDKLPDDLKKVVEYACKLNVKYTLENQHKLNVDAEKKFKELGIQKVVMEEESMKEIMGWVDKWFEAESAKDPFMAKVRQSMVDFCKWYYPYKQSYYNVLPYPEWAK